MSRCRLMPARVRTGKLLALLVAAATGVHAQQLDSNHNGASDVWEMVYGAEGADPDADSDHDGVPNRLEAVAGTNPFDARSVPRISRMCMTSNGVQVSMDGALGKHYELQSSESLGGDSANWTAAASLVARTNPQITLEAPCSTPARFFRMLVADVDTDGDGLSDWEEYQLGLDPLKADSNGQKDAGGKPLSDYQYIRNQMSRLPDSTIAGATAFAPDGLVVYPADVPEGTGLTGQYFTNSSTTYSNVVNFNPTNLFLVTNDAEINFTWGPATFPNLSNTFATVRWTGQVQPQYSETYVFETRSDDGAMLWVNDQLLIDRWRSQGTTSWTNGITLQAGVRYNIRMEYLNRGGTARAQLYWYSVSQPRQIIPSIRLYPSSDGLAPGDVTSPLTAISFLGQPFTYTITGANSPTGFGATNLPLGLAVDSASGVISGIPAVAGSFTVTLSVTNSVGVGEADLALEVIDTGSAVTREVWLNVPGTDVGDIPQDQPATLTNSLGTLDGILNFGDNYGERVRGWITAPETGNYYFWLSANSTAELWISNDNEPANKVRRATVTNPKGTLPGQWNTYPGQRSPWLSLEAGQRYYVEILHKAGKGANDHWSVGWLLDPTGTNRSPAGVVPGYVLSPYVNAPTSSITGTLYSANLVAQSGAASSGTGSATLRVNPEGTQAVLRFSYSGLSSPISGQHVHSDQYLNHPGQIIFDIDETSPQDDGSYLWNIVPVGTLSAADILEILRESKALINLHTVNYPGGEINGHFTLTSGTTTFTAPPLPPAWTDDHKDPNAAARFLMQATFGPTAADVKSVQSLGYAKWLDKQIKLKPASHLKNILDNPNPDPTYPYSASQTFNTWWQFSVTSPDQLRQRVAFALSEILVVSENGVLGDNALALSSYYDLLSKNAFGNFRNLLKDVTLSPAMGLYLDMRRNDRGNLSLGTHPNENYAREIMQLFSVGLNRMWPDGTLVLNSKGDIVPTYDQDVIIGYARVFTGWNYHQTNQASGRLPTNWNPGADYTNAMTLVPSHHEPGTKRLLDHIVLPAAQGDQLISTNAAYDAYASQDLEQALDAIFQNQNVGPFICRQLIQRLVTSHPSRDYLYRVVQKFNDNGTGVRGDMQAVVKAILLDYEARSTMLDAPTFGKQREPLLRATAMARAFPAPAILKGKYKQTGSQVIVTTSKPHRLSSSDDVYLLFTGKGAPVSQIYNNVAVSNASTFIITTPGVATGTYNQSGTVITVTNSGHGLIAGAQLALTFTSGGAVSGVYTVASVISGSAFAVSAIKAATNSGTCFFPKLTGGGFVQSGTTITFTTIGAHGLKAGNNVYVDFPDGTESPDGVYRVSATPAANRFAVTSTISTNRMDSSPVVLPLVAQALTKSGTVSIRYSTWNMNYTDSGNGSSLNQTPLNSPTVFNFFFPDYKFQGILASAGLTTPEFQLTSDTTVVQQMNFMSSGVFNNSSNTNGLSSFAGGNGAIMLDLGPYMTPERTADAGIPGLVDSLNTLLCGGQLSPMAKDVIVAYVANTRFPYTTPTPAQMRDRVRAVVHLIATSPDFTVLK